jgi:hypothetical protein
MWSACASSDWHALSLQGRHGHAARLKLLRIAIQEGGSGQFRSNNRQTRPSTGYIPQLSAVLSPRVYMCGSVILWPFGSCSCCPRRVLDSTSFAGALCPTKMIPLLGTIELVKDSTSSGGCPNACTPAFESVVGRIATLVTPRLTPVWRRCWQRVCLSNAPGHCRCALFRHWAASLARQSWPSECQRSAWGPAIQNPKFSIIFPRCLSCCLPQSTGFPAYAEAAS